MKKKFYMVFFIVIYSLSLIFNPVLAKDWYIPVTYQNGYKINLTPGDKELLRAFSKEELAKRAGKDPVPMEPSVKFGNRLFYFVFFKNMDGHGKWISLDAITFGKDKDAKGKERTIGYVIINNKQEKITEGVALLLSKKYDDYSSILKEQFKHIPPQPRLGRPTGPMPVSPAQDPPSLQAGYVQANQFFQDIVGMDENNFRNQYQWQKKTLNAFDMNEKNNWIRAYPRRAAIWQGNLEVMSIDELDKKIGIPLAKLNQQGSFKLLIDDQNNPKLTDVRSLVALPENKQAVFQVASTFWGPLEGGMAQENALLTGMFPAAAQGELISVCTAAAAIFRKYFMANKYYYLLDKLLGTTSYQEGRHGPFIKKGYLQDKRHLWNMPNYKNSSKEADDIKKVQLGLHKDIVVSLGRSAEPTVKPDGTQKQEQLQIVQQNGIVDTAQTQIVSLVFTSAFNLRDQKIFPDLTPEWLINFCTMILKASYLGTIKAAYYAGQSKVYLTLMGASAFRNKMAWIADALTTPKFVNFIKETGLEVILIFRPEPFKPDWRNAKEDMSFLEQLLKVSDTINKTQLANNQQLKTNLTTYLDESYNKKTPSMQLMKNINETLKEKLEVYPPPPPTKDLSGLMQDLRTLKEKLETLEKTLAK